MAEDFSFDTEIVAPLKTFSYFDLRTLSETDVRECQDVSHERVRQQVEEARGGDSRATWSYGGSNSVDRRSLEVREEHSLMGTLSEKIGSIYVKCLWTKEMGQYRGNPNPDLWPIFKKEHRQCDVRSSGRSDSVIHRPHQDVHKNPTSILIGITNLPRGPLCKVGWMYFVDVIKLAQTHPEWRVESKKDGDKPFYWIPFEFFSQDFSEFGE